MICSGAWRLPWFILSSKFEVNGKPKSLINDGPLWGGRPEISRSKGGPGACFNGWIRSTAGRGGTDWWGWLLGLGPGLGLPQRLRIFDPFWDKRLGTATPAN